MDPISTPRPLFEERVRFGRSLPPEVNALLQQAASHADDFPEAEQSLLTARRMAPEQLEVLVALYKLYFYRGLTEQAERIVTDALTGAASGGGFASDWRMLGPDSTDWRVSEGPARIYLYSLKALTFIRLRQGDPDGAAELLATLRRLDPDDQVGAGVLSDLAEGLAEES